MAADEHQHDDIREQTGEEQPELVPYIFHNDTATMERVLARLKDAA